MKTMKEFNCKASSTWSVCGRERDDAFAHRHSSPGMKKETSQQDYIIGPARRDDEMHIHTKRGYGQHGTITSFLQGYRREGEQIILKKGEEEVDRMETQNRR